MDPGTREWGVTGKDAGNQESERGCNRLTDFSRLDIHLQARCALCETL